MVLPHPFLASKSMKLHNLSATATNVKKLLYNFIFNDDIQNIITLFNFRSATLDSCKLLFDLKDDVVTHTNLTPKLLTWVAQSQHLRRIH